MATKPNQWVKHVQKTEINQGSIFPVMAGRPHPWNGYRVLWGIPELRRRGYEIGDYWDWDKPVWCDREQVELLGPDECARLDRLHGLEANDGD